LLGKPLIQHVYERAAECKRIGQVVVATDDTRIQSVVEAFGGQAIMTNPEHRSGTDRVEEVARQIDADIVINIQGDEVLLDARMLDELLDLMEARPEIGIATLRKEVFTAEEEADPGVVKVVTDARGIALYFSRSLLPYPRNRTDDFHVYEHLGIYGFRPDELRRFTSLPPSKLEQIEGLEQLRALENGIPILVGETKFAPAGPSVDTPEDLETVRQILLQQEEKVVK
jgi:3-deoxy-manno-octulosonate cytidylyltransferase (CMP-KDO synthetase)